MTEAPAAPSLAMVRIGGREYPQVSVAQCQVCQSPHRMEIEEELASGRTYAMIARRLAERVPEDEAVPARSIGEHYKRNHLPLQQETTRTIIEARAERLGRSVEQGIGSLVDGVTLLDTVVQRTFEGIADGSIKPQMRDGLAAAKMLAELGFYDQGLDQEAFIQAFAIYHASAKDVMDPEQFEAWTRMLDENTVLQALAAKFAENHGETVQGEIDG